MARYIDADYLKMVIEANDWSNPAVPDVVGIIIDRTPTANVVLRSELAIQSFQDAATIYSLQKELSKAKSEVEYQKRKQEVMLLDAIDTFRNLLCIDSYFDYEDTRKHYVVNIDDVNRIHDELKKKYTEGDQEEK